MPHQYSFSLNSHSSSLCDPDHGPNGHVVASDDCSAHHGGYVLCGDDPGGDVHGSDHHGRRDNYYGPR